MGGTETDGKKYVVRLSEAERDHLNALIRTGKHPAHQFLKARILLKADVSEAGPGWGDNQIATVLVQFKPKVSTSFKGACFIAPTVPRSTQRAHFCL